ncbi:MAG TPA: ATP-binding protein [Anaerolineaceae bacterium]|nr:ATP-binding protein [Anaerolineaceae bacterium]
MSTNAKEQIFVVISDPQVNYLLERILRSAGFMVTVTRERSSAEKMLEKASPSLVIVSEKLVDGNGMELARNLLDRFPALPILLFVSQDTPELLKEALRAGISDYLCLPLHSEQILLAVNNALQRSQRRREWVIVESKRATQGLQRRVDELESLMRLGRSITSSLDLDSVLSAVVDAAVELTGAEEGSLLLLDESTGELYMRAARNFQEEFVRTFRLPIKDSLAGNVIRTGQPVILDEKTPQKIKTAYLVQGLLYVPLQIHGHIFGVLGVDNRQSRMPFTDHHVKVITAMADYAVVAIENARLYSHTAVERNKLETILTQVQDGVIVIDLDERVVLINQTVRAAFNLGDGNLTGKLINEVFDHQDLIELAQSPEKRLSNRGEITLEDGRVFGAQLTPIPDVGQVITLHDITYLKKLDRIKSDFVSTVSHDLRSPLTAILGYVELLDRAGPINEQQRDFIRRVQMSVHNITALVDDLLNLGRIEAGFDTRKEMVLMDQILQYSIDSFKNRIAEKQQQLLIEVPQEMPKIFGNPVHLRQMTDNLIDNAIKYTSTGGVIQVRGQIEGNQLILQVIDSGVGIPALDLPYIFDKFYRASNVSTEVSGTGLGLAIVKSIVESHQGRIWVESNPGTGTTFTVVLPFVEPETEG